MIDWASHVLYGANVASERDRLLGDTEGVSARSVQARRGHVMRGIADQIAKWIADQEERES